MAELIRAACFPENEELLLESELEAFIQLENSDLVQITNPSALEREAAESVLLKSLTSSGISLIRTLKPGLMRI